MKKLNILALILLIGSIGIKVNAQIEVPFDAKQWKLINANIEDHLGRKSMQGTALLEGIELENGIIEVDVAVNGKRSYPGIIFRVEDMQNYERFYIRPHRSGLYPDALQYVPVNNGIAGWQLYTGQGYSNEVEKIPVDKWVHLKMVIKGKQAKLYIDKSSTPALEIHNLKTGIKKGGFGLLGPTNGTAYFSNFRYTLTDDIIFESSPYVDTIPGLFEHVLTSQPFTSDEIEFETYPQEKILASVNWKEIHQDPNGLIDFSEYTGRTSRQPNIILAKLEITAEKNELKKINFGYSDAICIFHNKNLVFSGNSAYRYRDPSFLGIIGLFDAVSLQLVEGKNEILFAVRESFGGWGLMLQDANIEYQCISLVKQWESEKELLIPESAAFDDKNSCIYVSNYDGYNQSGGRGLQSISKLNSKGEIVEKEWIKGLNNPTGLSLHNGFLFAVDRFGVIKIDVGEGKIVDTIQIGGASFLNDIAINTNGDIYVSDNNASIIFKYNGKSPEKWLEGEEVNRPNGLYISKGKLIWGNNGSRHIKEVDLETKEVKNLKSLNEGIIDGISGDDEGNIYFSHNEGRLYKLDINGELTKLLDLTSKGVNIADFDFSNKTKSFYIPTFRNNKLLMYKLK